MKYAWQRSPTTCGMCGYGSAIKNSRALEASVIPSTVVENYAQGDWDVEVDAKDVSL